MAPKLIPLYIFANFILLNINGDRSFVFKKPERKYIDVFEIYKDFGTEPLTFLKSQINSFSNLDVHRVKRQLPRLEGNQVLKGTFQAIMRPLGNNNGDLGKEKQINYNDTVSYYLVIIYVAVCNLNIWPNQYCQTTFNLLSVCTASMFKEEKDMQKPIYCGPISLVLKMSRVFGMAPLTFGPDGIKFSQVFYIYSIVFIASLKTAILVGFATHMTHSEQSVHANSAASHITWFAYQYVLTTVTVVGCFTAPKRCRSMLDTLTRIEKIKELVEETGNESREVKRIYTTIFSFLTTLAILTCVDLYQSLSKSYHLNKEGISLTVGITSMFLFYDVEHLIELLLEFQFMLVVFKLIVILRAVNKRLKLLQTKVSEEQSNEEIRVLWLVNELICDLVRDIDHGFGLLLLLLMQSFFLHFILTPYNMINLYQMPAEAASICKQVAWFHFYAANVVLIVEPCHLLQVQMAQTRSLVSKLLCQARPYGCLSRALTAFFKSLTLDQPLIAPLGMFVLERPLLITILAVVSAYLVPHHYSTNVITN